MNEYKEGRVRVGIPNYEHEILIYLPHQCDEWIVGTAEDARQLIRDLEAAITRWEVNDYDK